MTGARIACHLARAGVARRGPRHPRVRRPGPRARRHGARILHHTEATGIELRGDDIPAAATTRHRIATGTLIRAAGAWSRAVGARAGVDLLVESVRGGGGVVVAVRCVPGAARARSPRRSRGCRPVRP